MKEFLTSLTPYMLSRLHRQLSKEYPMPPFHCYPVSMSARYLENTSYSEVQLMQEIVNDGMVTGTIRTTLKREELKVRLYGIYFTEQCGRHSTTVDAKTHLHLFHSLLRPECSLKEQPQIFMDEEGSFYSQRSDEIGEWRFEFIVDPSQPNSLCFRMGSIAKTVAYVVEVRGYGLHYLKPVNIHFNVDYQSTDKYLSYVAADFQLKRACCMTKGVFRLESILPTNIYQIGTAVIGRLNYFRKSKGALTYLSRCRIDLIARVKWSYKGSKECHYIPVASKIINMDSEPYYGMVVGRYRLPLPTYLPPTCQNMLFTITYFTLLTVMDNPGGCAVHFVEERIRELYLIHS